MTAEGKAAEKPASLPDYVWEVVSDPVRRDVLLALSLMRSHEDEDFARVCRLAAAITGAASAVIAVVDMEQAWLEAAHGTAIRSIPVRDSFAAHAIGARDSELLVLDAREDPRFRNSTIVTGEPHIRFYLGRAVMVQGQPVGALQVFSPEPRQHVDPSVLAQLGDLADTAGRLFELKNEARVRERTAAELIKEEWRHALTLEAGKVGSWVWDIRTGQVVCNDTLRRMFGFGPTIAVTSDDIFSAMHDGDRPGVDAALKSTFEEGADFSTEYRIKATGRWLVARGRVYQRDASGAPLIMMGVNIDVTEARHSADHTRLLLRELNHRVKNTLAMIQSLARQTFRRSPDPQHFIEAFSGRLRTLSDAHALLSDRDWAGIGLVELVDSRVGPYLIAQEQLSTTGADVRLPPDHALALGLVLHELSVNAARFGALSVPQGRLVISWRPSVSDGRGIELSWKERGGPSVAGGEAGFGRQLIERGLDKIIGSQVRLSFPPNGVEANITLPLEAAG